MSSIVYSFNYIQHHKKKQRHSDSLPATDPIELKNSSFSWFNQILNKLKSNNDEEKYIYPNKYDLDFLQSIL